MARWLDIARALLSSLVAVALSGCMTVPAPQGAAVSADYKVDILVASLYWTDASVGRTQQTGR